MELSEINKSQEKEKDQGMKDVLIDIETLGRDAGCVVLSIAAVEFDRNLDYRMRNELGFQRAQSFIHNKMEVRLDVTEQLMKGYEIDCDTLEWWRKQDPAAIKSLLMGDEISLEAALRKLGYFLKETADADHLRVWSQGTDFDFSILRYMYHKVWGTDMEPWKYYLIRDARTYIQEMSELLHFDPHLIPHLPGVVKHSAMDDAIQSAYNIAYVRCLFDLPQEREL